MIKILQREQEETEAVYKEFVTSFEDSGKNLNKSWVKGGTVKHGKGKSMDSGKDINFRDFLYLQ